MFFRTFIDRGRGESTTPVSANARTVLSTYRDVECERKRGGRKMVEGRRTACRFSASSRQEVKGGEANNGTRMEQPHSCIFTCSTDTGAAGAKGRREQVGPEQGQGLLGSVGAGFGVAAFVGESGATGLRSMCVG